MRRLYSHYIPSYFTPLQVGNRLRSAVQELGAACIALVQDAGNLQSNPTDAFAKRDLNEHNRAVSEKVSY